jgi:adenylate kinase
MRIVMIGSEAAGIGMQAAHLSNKLNVAELSPGEMLRDAINGSSPAGIVARAALDRGEFIDDDTIFAVVLERLAQADVNRGFVLHGFPETVQQAIALDETLRQQRRYLHAVIEFTADRDPQSRQGRSCQ